MTTRYPNDFDIYGFCPKEKVYDVGDYVVDKRTGTMGRVSYFRGEYTVKVGGVNFPISE